MMVAKRTLMLMKIDPFGECATLTEMTNRVETRDSLFVGIGVARDRRGGP
jgi:hypothetical protein